MKEGGVMGQQRGVSHSSPPPGWAHTAAKMEAGREREKGGVDDLWGADKH